MTQDADGNNSNNIERAHYRLEYPENERPELILGSESYAIIELSEQGAHIDVGGKNGFAPNQVIAGKIHFKNGACDPINAVVLRIEATTIVVGLIDGISIKRMLDEQIQIRQKYPQLYRSDEGKNDIEG